MTQDKPHRVDAVGNAVFEGSMAAIGAFMGVTSISDAPQFLGIQQVFNEKAPESIKTFLSNAYEKGTQVVGNRFDQQPLPDFVTNHSIVQGFNGLTDQKKALVYAAGSAVLAGIGWAGYAYLRDRRANAEIDRQADQVAYLEQENTRLRGMLHEGTIAQPPAREVTA